MTINVGNLSVGGTGKTPMVEYLIQLLRDKYALATLSRGYKRKSKGFLLANASSTVNDLGDEPFQFHLKYGKEVSVAVGENRSLAIPRILMEHPETQTILMDDAYQHRTVTPDFNILLTQFTHPFYEDFILPSGNLRESRYGAKRAHVVVVTKCPTDLSGSSKDEILKKVRKYTMGGTPVFFSTIKYGMPIAYANKQKFSGKVILFAGVANIQPITEYTATSFNLVETISFSDHYNYTPVDIERLLTLAKAQNAQLLTTEKDMTKIRSNKLFNEIADVGLFYLPISVQFLFSEGGNFNTVVENAIIDKYEHEEIEDN